jgi:LEA14-like dessication related protein
MAWMGWLAIGGCAGIAPPTVQVERVDVQQATAQAARVQVVLAMENPNDDPLPLTLARYQVNLGPWGVYRGDHVPNATIPARGRQTITLPAAVAEAVQSRTMPAYRTSGSIEYVPPGEVRAALTELGLPLPSVSFSGSGERVTAPADGP